ncbi:hypothetical protein [[Mycobacterium] nativiensis]|uniref:Proline rich protein n=1 Tax=[Mycobacterium] nativiensis TaxID=2855503 RepID=A0ABU5Y359_9MYCO|nr:hypothetical protein [Mycolicibacter sp. MYC340]MEB3034645.1 hypothetical protein [Mycolicibacter sp. MYC340]
MSETPQPAPAPTAPPAPSEPKPYWVYRLAAWVAIVAGIVFIVSSIFLAGVYASGGMRGHHCHHGHHGHHHGAMFHKGPHRGPGPMMQGPEGEGPGELPPSVTKPPAPAPGR